MHQAKEPTTRRSTGATQGSAAKSLHCLASPFSRALALLAWLTLPGRGAARAQGVASFLAGLNLGAVTDQLRRGAATDNLAREGARELSRRLRAASVSDKRLRADENPRALLPAVDSWNIGLDGARGDRLISSSRADAGLGDLKRLRSVALRGALARWVVTSRAFLATSAGSQAKRGRRAS